MRIRTLTLSLTLVWLAGCTGGSTDTVTFNIVQPLGQKTVYSIKNDLTMETSSPEMGESAFTASGVMDAILESEVTARQPNGHWTLSSKFTRIDLKIDGETHEETVRRLEGRSFAVTLDRQGKIVSVTGIENLVPGMDARQMITQMSPSVMLPQSPVSVGASWPVEISNPVELAGATVNQTLRGTGTLRELRGGEAFIEFDYKLEMSMTGPEADRLNLSGTGHGKSSVSYDLARALFTSNRTDMTIETIGRLGSGEETEEIKNILKSLLQVNVVSE